MKKEMYGKHIKKKNMFLLKTEGPIVLDIKSELRLNNKYQ